MKKTIWVSAVVVVLAILALNAWLIWRALFAPAPSFSVAPAIPSEGPTQMPRTHGAPPPGYSQTPVAVVTPPPLTTVEPVPVPAGRMDLEHYFLASEVRMFISVNGSARGVVPEFTELGNGNMPPPILELADYLFIEPNMFATLFAASTKFQAVSLDSRVCFAQFRFEKEARKAMIEAGVPPDKVQNLLVTDAETAVIGTSGTSFTSRVVTNLSYQKGQGSFAELCAKGLSKELFLRFSASLSQLENSRFVSAFTKSPVAYEFYWDEIGVSSFAVVAEKVEPWVSFVARDNRLALSPFIPEDTPCAFGLSLPVDADRTLVAKALMGMIMPDGDQDAAWKDFGDTLGLTPDRLGMLTRSRFYLYFMRGMELAPENAVYTLDLPRSVTAEDLVNEMRNGQVFGGKPPLNMLEGGRKLFVADTGAEDLGFTVASLNNYLVFSGNHSAVKKSIEAFTTSKGLTARCSPEVATAICTDATAILRMEQGVWRRVLPLVIPISDTPQVTMGFKFSSKGARIDADMMPGMWFPLALLSVTQRARTP